MPFPLANLESWPRSRLSDIVKPEPRGSPIGVLRESSTAPQVAHFGDAINSALPAGFTEQLHRSSPKSCKQNTGAGRSRHDGSRAMMEMRDSRATASPSDRLVVVASRYDVLRVSQRIVL